MNKYVVYLNTVVSTAVEVEAEDGEDAVEKALETDIPGLMFLDHTYPDVGEWTTPSGLFPKFHKPQDDYDEV